ncbi:MAG: outer membrane beta-barrel family protein, partial [Muribaculaceae bacterium]|nr:outer membrane beta-barrel family protein [Muribaculaceae bacterium]
VRYIVDGHLLEMTDDAIAMKLKNLQSDGIEKIELLTTPPAKYAAGNNVAFISITTKNESLGTRGNVWGNGRQSDYFNYSLGGNVSHTTRKVELSGDVSWNDSKGKNDNYKEYAFADHTQVSDRRNRFTWLTLGANGLFKYKFDSRLSAGAIVNYSRNMMKTDLTDKTSVGSSYMLSNTFTPIYPENALTLTGFADWRIDSTGKLLSLTYNLFDKRSKSNSDVTTLWDAGDKSRLTKDADNRYDIHSVKLDASLPFSGFKMEAGAAYTSIGNKTNLDIANERDGAMVDDPTQSNSFIYDEKTAALYVSAERNLTSSIFGKIGLRYEHTDLTGVQKADNSRHDNSYDYLFPSAILSWNIQGGGRLSADYSMGITRPSFGDLNPFRYYNTVKDYFTGNPDLESVIGHNVGINYSFKGLYAVLYGNWNRNAIGYITRFDPDGTQWTIPENCMNTMKAGLYASYNRSLFNWWNINVGGEVFFSQSKSRSPYFREAGDKSWSGKLELNTSWMLNRKKSLIFNLRCSHYFPYQEKMVRYENRTMLNCELRYMLLDNRLTLSASVSDPFGWSVTKSNAYFKDYALYSKTNIHQHAVALRIAYSFGGRKVNNVYRDTKERESQRSY